MSTVATTRPPLTLALKAADLSQSFALSRTIMHPDCLLLHKYGVPSPRLSPNIVQSDQQKGKPCEAEMSAAFAKEHHGSINVAQLTATTAADEETEDDAEIQSHHGEPGDSIHCEVTDEELDAVSMCSDGSELSVGQESMCEEVSRQRQITHSAAVQQTQRLLLGNVNMGDMMVLCPPSAFSNVQALGDGSDARSSVSTDDAQQADEEVHGAAVMDSFAMANALRIPVPMVPRTNTSPFQEEFLRKSHIYAEELIKQQMQFMVAARASAYSLRNITTSAGTHALCADGKQGFRPQTKPPDMPNFAGIQSHLSAISKISQLSAAAAAAVASNHNNTPSGVCNEALAKLTALGVTPQTSPSSGTTANSISVSSLNQLQAQMQAHLPFMHNNNINEPALKFSIDNILKADFGRRITDPLLKRGGGSNSCGSNDFRPLRHANSQRKQKCPLSTGPTGVTAMDLTSLMTSATATATANVGTLNFSNSLANICTNSNDSNSTAVSSNYGCTSDFVKSPSSQTGGAQSGCSISPAPGQLAISTADSGVLQKNKSADTSSSNSSSTSSSTSGTGASGNGPIVWPAWVYCTRYSDRPSSGPRARKPKKPASEKGPSPSVAEDKRPRTAFSGSQLARLKHEFTENRYLTEKRRQQLSSELGLNEAQIKIWFQNKRAKLKKSSGTKNPLALQLMAQGLYNHSTVPLTREEEELQELQERENAAAAAAAGTETLTT